MHTKLGLRLCLGVLLAFSACGGDDEKPSNSDSADSGTGNTGGSRSSAAGSGKGTGSGKEGVECSSDKDCGSGLSCLKADANVEDLKVCARPCQKSSDCNDDEMCSSVADRGAPEWAMCWKLADKALDPCGPAFTSMCDDSKNLGCLRVESDDNSIAGGVCLEPCKLSDKDACSEGFSCQDIIDQPDMGLCVKAIKRGDACDEPNGEFCEDGNICLSDGGDWSCYQDCTDSKKCDDDKECKTLKESDGAYCE
jgi:hypothetical protein